MRIRALIVALGATAALLAGCTAAPEPEAPPTPTTNGMEDLEADEILDAATKALLDAGSFHFTGSGDADGEEIELDVVYAGNDIQGTITATGVTFDLLVVDGDSYFRGGEDLWSMFAGEETAQILVPLVSGKWVKLPTGTEGFDLNAGDMLTPDGSVTKGEVTEVGGQPAITLIDSDGGELYVSLVGEPYPLRIVADQGTIEITDIGDDVTIEAPAEDEIFDLSTFTG